MKTIDYGQALNMRPLLFIDARTSKEFNEATIPGAVNVPILNNEQRSQVGTVYSQESPAKAKKLAVEMVAPNIPNLIKKIDEFSRDYKNLLFFCSRGGMRSESLAQFCKLAGLKNIFKLNGGYKSYRRFILNRLENYDLKSKLIVLHGYTGVGKTELLYLLKEKGKKTIDLEGLANNRGSSFGSIGLGRPRNAKAFDSLLWERLEQIKDSKHIFIEAESKRIGQAILPNFLNQKMQSEHQILIKNSLATRCQRILAQYTKSYQQDKEGFIKQIITALENINKYLIQKLGKQGYNKLINNCQQAHFEKVVISLFKNYYDPLYDHYMKNYDFDLIIEANKQEKIIAEILTFTSDL